jgi:hypothetical protein
MLSGISIPVYSSYLTSRERKARPNDARYQLLPISQRPGASAVRNELRLQPACWDGIQEPLWDNHRGGRLSAPTEGAGYEMLLGVTTAAPRTGEGNTAAMGNCSDGREGPELPAQDAGEEE